jgi:hypothetical protein
MIKAHIFSTELWGSVEITFILAEWCITSLLYESYEESQEAPGHVISSFFVVKI